MQNLDQTMQLDVDKTMSTIFLHVLFNWNVIKENAQTMAYLDMNTNSLCRQLKQNDPTQRDGYIQAHVLSLLITMMYTINISTQKLVNTSSTLLGGALIQFATNTLMNNGNNTQQPIQPIQPIQPVNNTSNSDDDLLTPGDFLD